MEESKGPPRGREGTCAVLGLISFGKRKLIKYAVAGLSEHVSGPLFGRLYLALRVAFLR